LTRLPENQAVIEDSVMPVVQAGLHELVEDGAEIIPGLRMHDLSGHTQGQMMVMLADGHHCAVFPGDALHQPMQIYEPTWNSRFCELADVAIKSRLRLLEHCAEREACLFPAHFGHPHGGWVQRHGESFSFQPLLTHELV
jgi:glyoxylase-like metal-dependent hydrolase (beta-lactamase superfamily II)